VAGFRAELSSCHQPPSHQEQVAEREQGEEMRAVLGEAPVAGLHVTELALDGIRPVSARFQMFSACQFQGMSSSMRLIL